jgi:hypothetical protein
MKLGKKKLPEAVKEGKRGAYRKIYDAAASLENPEENFSIEFDTLKEATRAVPAIKAYFNRNYGELVFSVYRDGTTMWVEKL